MAETTDSLSHSRWDCKYHIVFIPKCRRAVLYRELRKHLGEMFRNLAQQKECRIEEGHLLGDDVHMLISIPPKYAVAQVVGFIKGKSAIHLPGASERGNATSRGAISGRGDTRSRRRGVMRKSSGVISGSSRPKTNGLNNSRCSTSKGRL